MAPSAPPGLTGATGPTGTAGIAAYEIVTQSFPNTTLAPGTQGVFEALCTTGKSVLGGGGEIGTLFMPSLSFLAQRSNAAHTGFQVVVANGTIQTRTFDVTVNAVCAIVTP